MIFKEFYNHSELAELFEAVLTKGVDDTTTVDGFLHQFDSPYLALQMIIYSMIANRTNDIDGVKNLNFKKFANYGNGKNKMTAFMASTTFPIEYSTLFLQLFQSAPKENPVNWAREHRDVVADLNNPAVRELILTLVNKYIN